MDKKIIAALKKAGVTEFVIGFKSGKDDNAILVNSLTNKELVQFYGHFQKVLEKQLIDGLFDAVAKLKQPKTPCKKSKTSSKKK